MNRQQLLKGGGTLVLGAAAFPSLATAAPSDGDLANVRLLIATELLKIDFATRALAAGKAGSAATALLRQAKADDTAHYDGLASLFSGAGQVPATAGDIDFVYPAKGFDSDESILRLARSFAMLALGAYNGALGPTNAPRYRTAFAQIAANEAQQAGALAQALGRPAVGAAFGPALSADDVTTTLDLYES
jgi:Ferritin-like domain